MNKIPLLLAAMLVAVPLVATAGPSVVPCRMHPLAELSRSVEAGHGVAPTLARIEAYSERSRAAGGMPPVVGGYHPTTRPGPSSTGLIVFVQDLRQGEPIQLTVWFDARGQLTGKSFVCG